MLTDTERRAVRLAETWFGVDRKRIEDVARAVLAERAEGGSADLMTALEWRGVLTPQQSQQLHQGLLQTSVDLGGAAPRSRLGRILNQEPERIGRFRVLRRLGEGGTGTVYLAFDKRHECHVAIKVLAPENADVPGLLDRFRREVKSGTLLNHPNIVRGFEAGLDRELGLHYLVMEYVDGPSVQSLLERRGRLAVADAVRIVLDIAHGLAYAHSQAIIHRDVKPGNILLTTSGQAKLADLGLSKKVDEVSHLTSHRQGVGTPYYVPYEQALNARHADARSDIYALGATLYHLLTGEVPFPGDSSIEVVQRKQLGIYTPARAINPALPDVLETILTKMLARRPEDRYPSATAMGLALERTGLAAFALSSIAPDQTLDGSAQQTHSDDPGQPTALDLEVPSPSRATGAFWHVRYSDEQGTLRKARLTVAEILRRLRNGKLSTEAEAASSPSGPFVPITSIAEIAIALQQDKGRAEQLAASKKTRARWMLGAVAGAVIGLVSLLALYLR